MKSIYNFISFTVLYILLNNIYSTDAQKPLNATVEVLVIVDNTVVNKYLAINKTLSVAVETIKTVYSYIIKQVDLKFQKSFSNDPNLRINIQLIDVLIYNNEADTPWINNSLVSVFNSTPNSIDAAKSLSVLTNTMNSRTLSYNYDYAIAVTHNDLIATTRTAKHSVISYSIVGSVCGTNRYTIMEDHGFSGVTGIAQDIGHIIGLLHDGDIYNPITKLCSPYSNFIMTPTIGAYSANYLNLNYFSNCSKILFKSLVTPSNRACLFNFANNKSLIADKRLPGTIWTTDSQCKLNLGGNSSYNMCKIPYDPICMTLYCYEYKTNTCIATSGIGAIDGTTCGTNKICLNSQCVTNTLGQFYN